MLAMLGVAVFAVSWIIAGSSSVASAATDPPVLSGSGVGYGYSGTIGGWYFDPPGSTWTFSSPVGSFAPSTVTSGATGRIATVFSLPVDAVIQTSCPAGWFARTCVPVTVTQDAAPHASYTVMEPVSAPQVGPTSPDPWHVGLAGQYFAPGENVALGYSTPGFLPPSATAEPRFGSFSLIRAVTPAPRPTTIQVTATGETYGRAATASIPILGTTLWTGQRLEPGFLGSTDPNPYRLASAAPGYYLESTGTGQLVIKHWTGSMDTAPITWTSSSGPFIGDSSLVMQTDGNLVLYSAGAAVWATGTGGTGSQNRLVMQSDGNLVVYTQLNRAVWSSKTGLVKDATWAYVSSSRSGSAVYINSLIHQMTSNGMTSPAGRMVYLQRYLNGAWQNMVARTTSSGGKITFGFIQPKVYQYRVLTTETTSARGAYSGSTFR